jgi:hypothetical protein
MMLAYSSSLRDATKLEIQWLKNVGVLAKRAPKASLLEAPALLELLRTHDKEHLADLIMMALEQHQTRRMPLFGLCLQGHECVTSSCTRAAPEGTSEPASMTEEEMGQDSHPDHSEDSHESRPSSRPQSSTSSSSSKRKGDWRDDNHRTVTPRSDSALSSSASSQLPSPPYAACTPVFGALTTEIQPREDDSASSAELLSLTPPLRSLRRSNSARIARHSSNPSSPRPTRPEGYAHPAHCRHHSFPRNEIESSPPMESPGHSALMAPSVLLVIQSSSCNIMPCVRTLLQLFPPQSSAFETRTIEQMKMHSRAFDVAPSYSHQQHAQYQQQQPLSLPPPLPQLQSHQPHQCPQQLQRRPQQQFAGDTFVTQLSNTFLQCEFPRCVIPSSEILPLATAIRPSRGDTPTDSVVEPLPQRRSALLREPTTSQQHLACLKEQLRTIELMQAQLDLEQGRDFPLNTSNHKPQALVQRQQQHCLGYPQSRHSPMQLAIPLLSSPLHSSGVDLSILPSTHPPTSGSLSKQQELRTSTRSPVNFLSSPPPPPEQFSQSNTDAAAASFSVMDFNISDCASSAMLSLLASPEPLIPQAEFLSATHPVSPFQDSSIGANGNTSVNQLLNV